MRKESLLPLHVKNVSLPARLLAHTPSPLLHSKCNVFHVALWEMNFPAWCTEKGEGKEREKNRLDGMIYSAILIVLSKHLGNAVLCHQTAILRPIRSLCLRSYNYLFICLLFWSTSVCHSSVKITIVGILDKTESLSQGYHAMHRWLKTSSVGKEKFLYLPSGLLQSHLGSHLLACHPLHCWLFSEQYGSYSISGTKLLAQVREKLNQLHNFRCEYSSIFVLLNEVHQKPAKSIQNMPRMYFSKSFFSRIFSG